MTTFPRREAGAISRPSRSFSRERRRGLRIAEEAQRHALRAGCFWIRSSLHGCRRSTLFDLTRVARRGPRHENSTDRKDQDQRASFVHHYDQCKLKLCRFKPCSSMRAACWSTPTGRGSADVLARHDVPIDAERLATAEPRAKKRLDTGETIQTTTDRAAGMDLLRPRPHGGRRAAQPRYCRRSHRVARLSSDAQPLGNDPG